MIPDTLPFLDSIKVQMKSPFEVRVDVSERDPVAYVNKGSNAYFDENGLVLDITDEVYDGVPVVTGADVDTPVLYQKLPVTSSAQLRTILSVTQLLNYQELEAKEIRFDESGDITVYIGKVEAMLGQDEYMEEKIANLRAILKKMGNESGTLHLESFTGKNDTATFRPSDEPETETETETDAAGDTGGDDTSAAGDVGTGSDSSTAGDATVGNDADGSGAASSDDNVDGSQDQAGDSSATISMVFDSSGTLVYNVHVENGTVVDANGNPVSGCSVDSDGYVVDAYMNRFDPDTGELVQ